MKKFIIYPVLAIITAVAVIYRKVIFNAAANIHHIKGNSIKKKATKQRKKSAVAQKTLKMNNQVEKQAKPKDIKLVRETKPKSVKKQVTKAQRQKSKKVVNIK